jgi:ParB family chromosome partitioning protein
VSGPMSEEQKAERKTLIANNKAWASVLLTAL